MDMKRKYEDAVKAARVGKSRPSPFYDERLKTHAAPMLSAFDEFVDQLPEKPWWDVLRLWVAMADISIWVSDRHCEDYRISADVPGCPYADDDSFEATVDHPVYCVSKTTGGLFPHPIERVCFDTIEEAIDCFLGEVCDSIFEAEKYWSTYPDADKWVPPSRKDNIDATNPATSGREG